MTAAERQRKSRKNLEDKYNDAAAKKKWERDQEKEFKRMKYEEKQRGKV